MIKVQCINTGQELLKQVVNTYENSTVTLEVAGNIE